MKIHYVPKQQWDAKLFGYAACGLYVEMHKHPVYCRVGSTRCREQTTCKNCKRTKLFKKVK